LKETFLVLIQSTKKKKTALNKVKRV
jgi:hypothetical protein